MLLFVLFALVGHVDVILPVGPSVIGTGDLQTRGGATSRIFILNSKNPVLSAMKQAEITNRDVILAELPDNVILGAKSLFYMKQDTSTQFVFTDQTRTHVYYGTNASGQPVVSSLSCGPFEEISDIHIAESASGTTYRLVVADKKADTVYSYTLTPNGSALCSSALSATMTSPLWIQSLTAADPTIFVGYKNSSGLQIRSYKGSDMTALTAEETLSTKLRAEFGKPFFDVDSSELFVPIKYSDDPTNGNDYIQHYDSTFSSSTHFSTCRSPVQIARDFEGNARYRYVLCPSEKVVRIYDTSDVLLKSVSAGNNAVKMLVGSDGTTRFIAVLQADDKLILHKTAIASNPLHAFTSTTITLPARMSDIGHFGALDYAVLVSAGSNLITTVNLNSQAVADTLYHPNAVNSMAAQSSAITHFVSTSANTAYTLTELAAGNWRLRHFNVGTAPVQIGYRTNRLYVLNRGSDNVSVVNLVSNAVTNLATQTRPIQFDFNTTADRLWAVNETSESFTTIDITSGSEARVGDNALTFAPRKILYQANDSPPTLYVAGETSIESFTASTLASVATQTLPGPFTDMALLTAGVSVSSMNGISLSAVTPSAITNSTLTSSPHLLSGNSTISVAGLLGESTLSTSSGLTKAISPFSRLFSNGNAASSSIVTYFPSSKKVGFFPISLFSSTTFPSLTVSIDIDPAVTAFDGSNNLWMADLSKPRIQRITSAFQREVLASLSNNTSSDITAWTAKSRIYVTLRSVNAVAVYDPATPALSVYSVCRSPRKLALDTNNSQLFVLCPESDALSVLTLNGTGDVSAAGLIATQKRPMSMALNLATDKLYVANMKSDSVSIYDTTDNSLIVNRSVSAGPYDLAVDPATDHIKVVYENSTNLTTINGSTNAATSTDTGFIALREIAINPTSSVLYALSPAKKSLYTTSTASFALASNLAGSASPLHLSTSIGTTHKKTYVTYPSVDVVRIYGETGTSTDVAVGSEPLYAHAVDSAVKTYVTNFSDDSVTILNLNNNAVIATVSLTAGCGPTKMTDVTISAVKYLYVLCQSNDTLEVINTASNALGTAVSLRF
jgi:YVTN family beta-propeller protein